MRPERNAVTGDRGFAASIEIARDAVRLPPVALGDIKTACLSDPDRVYELLVELRAAVGQLLARVDLGAAVDYNSRSSTLSGLNSPDPAARQGTHRAMAPEDVHNVAFSKAPSGKQGYNEDEVDASSAVSKRNCQVALWDSDLNGSAVVSRRRGSGAVQGRPADPEELGDVLARVAVGLHPACHGDLGGVVYLAGPTELPAVCPGGFTLKSGPLLDQLALEPTEPRSRRRCSPMATTGSRLTYVSLRSVSCLRGCCCTSRPMAARPIHSRHPPPIRALIPPRRKTWVDIEPQFRDATERSGP